MKGLCNNMDILRYGRFFFFQKKFHKSKYCMTKHTQKCNKNTERLAVVCPVTDFRLTIFFFGGVSHGNSHALHKIYIYLILNI